MPFGKLEREREGGEIAVARTNKLRFEQYNSACMCMSGHVAVTTCSVVSGWVAMDTVCGNLESCIGVRLVGPVYTYI